MFSVLYSAGSEKMRALQSTCARWFGRVRIVKLGMSSVQTRSHAVVLSSGKTRTGSKVGLVNTEHSDQMNRSNPVKQTEKNVGNIMNGDASVLQKSLRIDLPDPVPEILKTLDCDQLEAVLCTEKPVVVWFMCQMVYTAGVGRSWHG